MKKNKYINHANFTSNLHVLDIKLAQNTKQFRRLVQEKVITVIFPYSVENAFLGAYAVGFGAAEHRPLPCVSTPLSYNM